MADWTASATKSGLMPGQKVRRKQAAEAMSLRTLCYVNGDGKLAKADASAAATCKGQLYIVVAGAQGNTSGTIAADEWVTAVWMGPVPGFSSLDETKMYYVSDTAGKGADAPGTKVRPIGYPDSSEVFMFNPGHDAPSD